MRDTTLSMCVCPQTPIQDLALRLTLKFEAEETSKWGFISPEIEKLKLFSLKSVNTTKLTDLRKFFGVFFIVMSGLPNIGENQINSAWYILQDHAGDTYRSYWSWPRILAVKFFRKSSTCSCTFATWLRHFFLEYFGNYNVRGKGEERDLFVQNLFLTL